MSADLSKYCQVVRVKNELLTSIWMLVWPNKICLALRQVLRKQDTYLLQHAACYITRRAYDQMMI